MTSPTLRRWEVARRLRQLREHADLSLDEVASTLGCSASKISRIETAARGASPRDVRDLCNLYNVTGTDRDSLIDLVRESKEPSWWRALDEVTAQMGMFYGLEAAASTILQYETILVPGLLQTPDYARALLRRLNLRLTANAAEQLITSRQERQKRLLARDAPSYWVVLDEAVIHRQVGGPKIMHDQVQHLVHRIEERRVVLQVIPFNAGAHAGMDGNFTTLRYEGSQVADQVYVEGRAGQLYLSRQAELKLYLEIFDHLRAIAESPDDSLERLRHALTSWPD
jgi:transcriptional regulator with XRE-family HTH domain